MGLLVVNFQKSEYLHPHDLGDGHKRQELHNTLRCLMVLLDITASSSEDMFTVAGAWAGDPIEFIELSEVPGFYRNVSPAALHELGRVEGVVELQSTTPAKLAARWQDRGFGELPEAVYKEVQQKKSR